MIDNTPEFILLDLEDSGRRPPPFKASADEARDAVFSGRASLFEIQKTPPFWVLDELERRFVCIDKLGPPAIDKKAFENIYEHVFSNGLMQNLVNGETLHWADNQPDLFNLIETTLSDCTNRDQNILAQAMRVFKVFFHQQKLAQESIEITDPRYNRETYVISAESVPDGSSSAAEAYFTGEEWTTYNAKLNTVYEKLFELVKQSFKDGRILVCEKQNSGAVLVSPETAVEEVLKGPDFLYHYLLTNDLPSEWFYSPEELPARMSKAIRWLENSEKKLDAKGVRASKGDYANIMMRKFDLTMNAVSDVWKRANRIHKDVSGNIPASIKATKTDLLEIELDN